MTRPQKTVRGAKKASRSWTGAALARGGLAARGIVYAVLAYLTVDIAQNSSTKAVASSQGAFDVIEHQPAGPVLVIILAAGFCAYASWRLLQAVAGDAHETGGEELAKRVGWSAIALVYAGLAVSAFRVALSHGPHQQQASSLSHQILTTPPGQVVLAAIGTGVFAGGIWLAIWAGLQRFDRYLRTRKFSPWLEATVRVGETFGNIVRGLVFAGIGASLFVAAVVDDAKDAKGLNGALKTLAGHPFGKVGLAIAAAGFLSFGASSLFEAWFRDVQQNVKKAR